MSQMSQCSQLGPHHKNAKKSIGQKSWFNYVNISKLVRHKSLVTKIGKLFQPEFFLCLFQPIRIPVGRKKKMFTCWQKYTQKAQSTREGSRISERWGQVTHTVYIWHWEPGHAGGGGIGAIWLLGSRMTLGREEGTFFDLKKNLEILQSISISKVYKSIGFLVQYFFFFFCCLKLSETVRPVDWSKHSKHLKCFEWGLAFTCIYRSTIYRCKVYRWHQAR